MTITMPGRAGIGQMSEPQVSIDLARIERNARTVVEACRASGIGVFGVTKGTCGMPQVARAMLSGGVEGIAESRFENIRRLRDSGIDAPVMLLRSPPFARCEEVVRSVDVSLNSEFAILAELSRVAERMGRVHDVILMVDLGDLREGIWPSDLVPMVERIVGLPGVRIAGLGTNLTCFGAILPTEKNLSELVHHAETISDRFGIALEFLSGGNSSSLPLLLAGRMPRAINNLRIGEAILQGGRDTFFETPWQALERDAFLLSGELLEVKRKPSVPIGTMGVDAFGKRPVFRDKGDRLRGILNIGREDVVVEGLEPVDPGVTVEGASSDHLILDLTDARPVPAVGGRLSFRMSYGALLAAMTSEYVEKMPTREPAAAAKPHRIAVLAQSSLAQMFKAQGLDAQLQAIGRQTDVIALPDSICEDAGPVAGPVVDATEAGDTILLLARDHRATLAALGAVSLACDAFGLIWLDAKPSFMPAVGERPPVDSVLYRALDPGGGDAVTPQLSPENVALVGLREASPLEAEAIKASRVAAFTMVDVDALGIREVIRQALRIATAGTRGIYVSYSPSVTDFPGLPLGTGGITVRETHQAMESIAAQGSMLAMDVVDLDAECDPRIASQVTHFILSAFGKRIL
jgi:ornithine racemase